MDKNINKGNISTGSGSVHLGDNNFYYKSVEYQDFQEKIAMLRDLVGSATSEEKKTQYQAKLNIAQEALEKFKKDVLSLAKTFQAINIDTERLKRAKEHFDKGEFKEARAILDAEQIKLDQDTLLKRKEELEKEQEKNEQDLKHNADEFLVKAKLTEIEYSRPDRVAKTNEYYEASLKSYRHIDNLYAYALWLQEDMNKLEEALELYREALDHADIGSEGYISQKALVHNNLGNLYKDMNIYAEAENQFNSSMEIRRKLWYDNKQVHDYDMAVLLNNYAILLNLKGEFERAEKYFLECLDIRKRIYNERHESTYLMDVAMVQTNLGIAYKDMGRWDEAISLLEESLHNKIAVDKQRPGAMADSGNTYNALGIAYKAKDNYDKAIAGYNEALRVFRINAMINPKVFEGSVAMVLGNLGNLCRQIYKKDDADKYYQEAIIIYTKLLDQNFMQYAPTVGALFVNIAMYQHQEGSSKEVVMEFLDHAIRCLLPIETPMADTNLCNCVNLLAELGEDPQAYLAQFAKDMGLYN
ncbi:tetratricopeptide repeat protein [Roseivirga sp. BDSF3-8]|uniref:tetratricopeptide repeat protein n=1 Tax=Roseivirga sp. BDSF3-8 TaxID=3241598 RepID=UPI003531CC2D